MTRPTKAQVHHAMTHREGWSFMGSETTMPGTGWEKFEVLAAEVEALRDEHAELRVAALRLASAVRSMPPDIEPATDALLQLLGVVASANSRH